MPENNGHSPGGAAALAEPATEIKKEPGIKALQGSVTPLIPSEGSNSIIVVGFDPSDGSMRVLNLGTLVELLRQSEALYTVDRLDDRNIVQATIAAGAAVNASARQKLTVPANEIWEVHRIRHIQPGESGPGVGDIVQTNVRISSWPDPAGDADGRAYNSANIGLAAAGTTDEDLEAVSEIGSPLRLEAGQSVTLVATLTGNPAGADRTATLQLFGRKLKKLT